MGKIALLPQDSLALNQIRLAGSKRRGSGRKDPMRIKKPGILVPALPIVRCLKLGKCCPSQNLRLLAVK